jgi:hyperosmotically inducible periplasmic protein
MEEIMRVTVWSAMAFAVVGNVAVASAADKPDDRKENRVEARLSHDARLKGQDIHVDVDEGVARLKGKVATEADKVRAERLARQTAGVTRVENQLEVDPSVTKDRIEHQADKTKERIDDDAKRAKERVDTNAKVAKERVDERAKTAKENVDQPGTGTAAAPVERRRTEPVGDQISDTWITTKVKTQFVGVDVLKGSDISVDTSKDGVVTLNGTVASEAARARAVEIVRTTRGVKRVVDNLKVK